MHIDWKDPHPALRATLSREDAGEGFDVRGNRGILYAAGEIAQVIVADTSRGEYNQCEGIHIGESPATSSSIH
ncbi:hypothetical protein [Planctopirus hydrillae]|uniref:Uncharacterized protein n=1 Tax=Planctopirus hydrillae TaxID=1841610 RepID=A0A1C3EJZ8_9PLAN|nr:hypothetical protein [Planctopirus hydrillae]ODA33562.1 hypothetical protein A6X21_18625 [Planctopirus hydrillae]